MWPDEDWYWVNLVNFSVQKLFLLEKKLINLFNSNMFTASWWLSICRSDVLEIQIYIYKILLS